MKPYTPEALADVERVRPIYERLDGYYDLPSAVAPVPAARRRRKPVPQFAPLMVQIDPALDDPKLRTVYIIRAGNHVKIGTAKRLRERLRGLLAGMPCDFTLVAAFIGGHDLERSLHRRFAAERYRFEWFHFRGALKDWIEAGCP